MEIAATSSNCKSREPNSEPNSDRVVHVIAARFFLTIRHAKEIVRLAGIGEAVRQ